MRQLDLKRHVAVQFWARHNKLLLWADITLSSPDYVIEDNIAQTSNTYWFRKVDGGGQSRPLRPEEQDLFELMHRTIL